MPLRTHFTETAAFEPEAIQAMSTAFDLSCADLEVFAGDVRGREIVATRIVNLARNGLLDPDTLHKVVVAEARASKSKWEAFNLC